MENIDFERLDMLLRRSGKSKAYLCRMLGRSPYYLRDAKRVGTKLKTEDIELIASELECSPEYLCGQSDDDSRPQDEILYRREIDDIYDGLNPGAQTELCRYGEYLLSREDCRAEEPAARIDYIRHYLTAAAAGYAAPCLAASTYFFPLFMLNTS